MNKRYWDIVERVANSQSSPAFVGRGKLTNYKDKSDSWILNQMKTKKPDSGIEMNNKGNNKTFKTKGT